MKSQLKTIVIMLLVGFVVGPSAAYAINEGFETGNTTGWTLTVPSGGSAAVVITHVGETLVYSPVSGTYFLELKTNGPGSYTTATQSFVLNAGDTVSGSAAFDAHDYLPYNDNAQVRVFDSANSLVATPFTSDVATVGDYGDGPWTPWSFTALLNDTYTVEYRVTNVLDSILDSHALFDANELDLDIKPGSFPNSINPKSKGRIPVGVLTTANFDATDIDPTTIYFGLTGTEAAVVHYGYEDLDGDGDTDLITHFKTQETGIACTSGHAFLTAKTISGDVVSGSDSFSSVGGSCH